MCNGSIYVHNRWLAHAQNMILYPIAFPTLNLTSSIDQVLSDCSIMVDQFYQEAESVVFSFYQPQIHACDEPWNQNNCSLELLEKCCIPGLVLRTYYIPLSSFNSSFHRVFLRMVFRSKEADLAD
jgi:hypothetical protein